MSKEMFDGKIWKELRADELLEKYHEFCDGGCWENKTPAERGQYCDKCERNFMKYYRKAIMRVATEYGFIKTKDLDSYGDSNLKG